MRRNNLEGGAKMRFLKFLPIFLVLVMFLSGCAKESAQKGQKDATRLSKTQYIDPEGYFKLHPPEGWKINEYSDDPRGKVSFIGPEANVDLRILASIKDFSSFDNLWEADRKNAEDIKKRFGIFFTLEKENFLDRPAIKRTWVYKGIKFFAIDFMVSNIRHDLQYASPQKGYDKYLPIVLKAMETFEPSEKGLLSPEEVKKHALANRTCLAKLFLEQGDFEIALDCVKAGLEIDPQNQELLGLKKRIEETKGKR